MKKEYIKPSMQVYDLPCHPTLLQASNLDGDNPLNWGIPGNDR